MRLSLDEIRRQGLNALEEHLGKAGMVRFLMQYSKGSGNYAQKRHKWAGSVTIEEIQAANKKIERTKRNANDCPKKAEK